MASMLFLSSTLGTTLSFEKSFIHTHTNRYGARQQDIFQNARGGKILRRYLNECDNAKYSALTFSGGNAFRKDITTWSINSPIVGDERVDLNALLNSMNDAALHEVMTDLGGHCFETVRGVRARSARISINSLFHVSIT